MKILHLDLKFVGDERVEFRYFWDNPNDYQPHNRSLTELQELIQQIDTAYHKKLDFYSIRNELQPEDYAKTGQALYNWLDGSRRILQGAINQHRREEIVLAISTSERLAHLPWEVLHDGKSFLVERTPARIIPFRWVKDEDEKQLIFKDDPENRALNVLFMATSPLGIEPELDYEAEEGQILEATKRKPLSLTVEESGCLTELGYLVEDYERGYFDVIHLTGHATVRDQTPYFITETELGEAEYSSAEDIARELKYQLPKLIFLSGCRTGYSGDEGTFLSMAEALLNQGATAILGWGHTVRDTEATGASATLYQELSAGRTLVEAVALTYQTMLSERARDWHLLRLYVAKTIPGALVTPLRTRGRKQLRKPTTTVEFRDDGGRLRVVSREEFVGRRRQLQNCLRTLKTDYDKVGVLLHGMGGWGKSSIASRLWDRLPEHEKILWWRNIDEPSLIKKLKKKLDNSRTRELISDLENYQLELESRFTDLFSQLAEMGEKPFLLILDDFEWNLEPREGQYILKPKVAPILEALVDAIQETGTDHRIIITCRYEFDSELLKSFFSQGLEPLRKAELTKKLNRLEHFSSDNLSKELRERALNLADGNPRLLEFLNNDILDKEDVEAKLTELEQSPELWKDKIIWEELYQLIDEPLQQILSYCLVYELRVPMKAIEAVCQSLPNYQYQLQRGLDLGLIEMSPEPIEEDRVYRVSRILPHIILTIGLSEEPRVYSLYRKAHNKLHQLWGNKENGSEEKWKEIFRLLFADKDNPQRFRQGFSQMLSFQDNDEADRALESELRLAKYESPEEISCYQLEDYLKQGDWRKADEETTWLFYLVMVQQGYKDWDELCKNFPSRILNEIDQLWIKYSRGQFGFSIQKQIWESVGGSLDTYEKFFKQVEWSSEKRDYYNRNAPIMQGGFRIAQTSWYKGLPPFQSEFLIHESPGGILPALIHWTTAGFALPTVSYVDFKFGERRIEKFNNLWERLNL